jgi:hypothetical protein
MNAGISRETVVAARYLASQRSRLLPRRLVLACQGVVAEQHADFTASILEAAQPGDWLGLSGWCLLGRARRLLSEFERTILTVLPLAVARGIRHVHLFGVLWLPALGRLLWLADTLGLTARVDNSAPVVACTRGDPPKAGC